MLTLTTCSFSLCSPAISSSTGATILHGPHHSAQKSTSTGLSLCSTSLANVASVTVFVLAPICRALLGSGRCPVEQSGTTIYARNVLRHRATRGRTGQVGGVLLERGQPPLGVQGGGAARARGGDRLPVGVVDQVTRGEHARQVGL